MHILIVVVIGLTALAVFAVVARLLGGEGHALDGAWPFIWLWLVASIANGAYGVVQAGIPVLNEIGAFIPIFGVPAGGGVVSFATSSRPVRGLTARRYLAGAAAGWISIPAAFVIYARMPLFYVTPPRFHGVGAKTWCGGHYRRDAG